MIVLYMFYYSMLLIETKNRTQTNGNVLDLHMWFSWSDLESSNLQWGGGGCNLWDVPTNLSLVSLIDLWFLDCVVLIENKMCRVFLNTLDLFFAFLSEYDIVLRLSDGKLWNLCFLWGPMFVDSDCQNFAGSWGCNLFVIGLLHENARQFITSWNISRGRTFLGKENPRNPWISIPKKNNDSTVKMFSKIRILIMVNIFK